MSYALFALLAALPAAAALAAEPPAPPAGFLLDPAHVSAAARDVTPARYPDADRVLVDDHVLEAYERDGTSVVWDDEYAKILTEKGRRDGAAHELFFDLHYGTSFVFRAELLKPDGRTVAIDTEKYSRVMTETGQMGANIYDPASKLLSFSLPGLEVGDVCHVVTCRITRKARVPDTWGDHAVLEADMPIRALRYEISAPPERPIRHALVRAPVTGTVSYAESALPGGRTLHAWRVKDVPQLFPEPDMPPLATQVQRLLLSTVGDWREVSRWYWRLCEPALAKITPEIKEQVRALTAGAASRDEKIRRLFKFVSQEIRYMGINAEDVAPGYEPHEVGLTFKNRYGVCRDKAALLAAMLTEAGVPGYPVLIHAGAKMDPDVPLPFFNHAITAVDKPGGGYQLMDPTDENTRDLFPAYLCDRSYLVARPEGETLLVSDVYPAEKNLARVTTEGALDEAGALLLKTRVVFEGINDNAYRGHFLRLKAEERRKFFEGLFKARFAGAEVLACDLRPADLQDTSQPLAVDLTCRVPDFPVRGESLDLASIPWLGTSLGVANFVIGQTGLERRRYPLETGLTCGIEERVTLDVAAGLGACHSLPADVRLDRGGVLFEMRQTCAGGALTGSLRYLLKTPEFSPAAYLELKRTLSEMEAASRRRPLFKAWKALPPDQEILASLTDVQVFSPQVWTTTQTWTKRVLTYAGKKKAAELKFGYNPVWQSLELVSATVSNAGGAVFSVSPKEINVMDAGWAGSAPRYPAAKTLVVNLPGVETGSVISVTTRLTQTNGCFYAQRHAFGGTEPVRDEAYRLTFPRALKPTIQGFFLDSVAASAVTNAGAVSYEWRAARPPLLRSEEQMPPWHFHQPTLFVSFGAWRDYARDLRRAVARAADADDAARLRARELTRGLKDPRARLRAVRDDVLRRVRIAGPSFLDLPLDCLSSPDQTLADQYGHAADRALLLASMLDAAGFDAELLLASGDTTACPAFSQPQRDTPQRDFYRSPVVAVRLGRETLYLNEGDQYDEPGASGLDAAYALDLAGRPRTLAVPPAYRGAARAAWTIDLDARGAATVSVTNWFSGPAAGPFRRQYDEMLPEDRRRHHLELVGSIAKSAKPASDLFADTAAYPACRGFRVTAADYATVDGDTLTLLIPEVAGALFPLRADTRENPLFLSARGESEHVCRIILPPGYTRLPLLPEAKRWTLPCGFGELDYRVDVATRADGRRVVTITRRHTSACGEAPPELYPALLEYNRRFSHPSNRTLVAERAP